MKDHHAFMAARRTGIGGSDIAALFSVGYGCRLRLWRDKRGEKSDFEDEMSGPMELGVFLEPLIADKYAQKTGRKVRRERQRRHKVHTWATVNIDRSIKALERSDLGVLEIKAMGRGAYAKMKREGMLDDYLLQLQHGMFVTGRKWGAFCVMSRDSGEVTVFPDMDRDESVISQIIEQGEKFWALVENGPKPDMLDPEDPRCQDCQYRVSCQGAALAELAARQGDKMERDESLAGTLTEFHERQSLVKEAEELLKETKEVLKTKLGERPAVLCGDNKIYYRAQRSMRWQADQLAKAVRASLGTVDYDMTFIPLSEVKAAEQFKSPVDTRPLRIY